MRPVTNEQAQEWVAVATEAAIITAEGGSRCRCPTCIFLITLHDTRRESSDPPRKKGEL